MRISELAAAGGCHLETIRYYERIGLLPRPARTGSGYRAYGPDDVRRVRFISQGRALGFSLDEIRSLLRLAEDPVLSCSEVDALAGRHLLQIRQRIGELQAVARALETTIASCRSGRRGECAVLDVLQAGGGERRGHTPLQRQDRTPARSRRRRPAQD